MTKTDHNHRITLPIITTLLLIILSTVNWVQASPQQQERSGAPTIVSYQGNIWEGDESYDGTGYFKFAVVDLGGTTTYWSNDGTSTGGAEPTASISLGVENGLFSLLLGDTSLTNMTAVLDESVFSDPDTYLRIWFSADGFSPWAQLPDQKIASVPYALQAQSADSASNADTLDGQHAAAFQLRVTGSCPVGQAVRAVNSDGSVVCEEIPQVPTFTLSSLDTSIYGGDFSSITIGTDGYGLISYHNGSSDDLKIAHCADINCTSVTTTTLDTTGNVGWYTSIAIGTDGYGLISYYDSTNKDLKVAHCNNTDCTSGTTYTLDALGNVGQYTSIGIGLDGYGLISYSDSTNGSLKVAHCSNTNCSTATLSTADTNDSSFTSIAIGSDGFGLISYYLDSGGTLMVAHCTNTTCSTSNHYPIYDTHDDVGYTTSIAIGIDGFGLISYFDLTNENLMVAHCNDITCSGANNYTIDGEGSVGNPTSITIGIDGLGLISYYDTTNSSLKVAHCTDTRCTSATKYTIDEIGDVGLSPSSTIGLDGLGLISYYDASNGDLKVAHCSNIFCYPMDGSMLP